MNREAVRLSVNVDHVATVRQARRASYPDPVEAARIAEAAGAHGITVHLRGDRRHIQDSDVERLRKNIRGKLNLEMSIAEEMVELALRWQPDQVSLVPENPNEVTTEGGLDLFAHRDRVGEVAERLGAAGIAVSVFVDPDLRQIEVLSGIVPRPEGFEINTDAYTRAFAAGGAAGEETAAQLRKVARVAELGRDKGLRVYAGHGLTAENVPPIAATPGIEELNIGHALVSRAVLIGMDAAVREMLAAMA